MYFYCKIIFNFLHLNAATVVSLYNLNPVINNIRTNLSEIDKQLVGVLDPLGNLSELENENKLFINSIKKYKKPKKNIIRIPLSKKINIKNNKSQDEKTSMNNITSMHSFTRLKTGNRKHKKYPRYTILNKSDISKEVSTEPSNILKKNQDIQFTDNSFEKYLIGELQVEFEDLFNNILTKKHGEVIEFLESFNKFFQNYVDQENNKKSNKIFLHKQDTILMHNFGEKKGKNTIDLILNTDESKFIDQVNRFHFLFQNISSFFINSGDLYNIKNVENVFIIFLNNFYTFNDLCEKYIVNVLDDIYSYLIVKCIRVAAENIVKQEFCWNSGLNILMFISEKFNASHNDENDLNKLFEPLEKKIFIQYIKESKNNSECNQFSQILKEYLELDNKNVNKTSNNQIKEEDKNDLANFIKMNNFFNEKLKKIVDEYFFNHIQICEIFKKININRIKNKQNEKIYLQVKKYLKNSEICNYNQDLETIKQSSKVKTVLEISFIFIFPGFLFLLFYLFNKT